MRDRIRLAVVDVGNGINYHHGCFECHVDAPMTAQYVVEHRP